MAIKMVEILLFACIIVCLKIVVEKTTKCPYLGHFASKWKNKGTLFSSTLKVKGNKVLLFFIFGLKRLRYHNFLVFIIICSNINDEKTTKWPYLGRFDSKWKNKGTLFSSTLKVEVNKVLLFFHFGLKSPRYEHFLVFYKSSSLMTSTWARMMKMMMLILFIIIFSLSTTKLVS